MHFLSLLTVTGLLAVASAAPSTVGNVLNTRQECPYEDYYLCAGTIRSACLSSGLEICKETGCGGPCQACDKFCLEKAVKECQELGCEKPNK